MHRILRHDITMENLLYKVNAIIEYKDIYIENSVLKLVFTVQRGFYYVGSVFSTHEVELPFDEYAGQIVDIQIVSTDNFNTVVIHPKINRANDSFKNHVSGDVAIARISFDTSSGEVECTLCLQHPSPKFVGFEDIVMDSKTLTHVGYMMKYSPMFKNTYENIFKKSRLLIQYDFHNSLAYLEANCDILNELVTSIFNRFETLTESEKELLSLLNSAREWSVLKSKDSSKILAEFEIHKKEFQNLKKEYE